MYPTESNHTNQKVIASVVLIIAVAIIAAGAKAAENKEQSSLASGTKQMTSVSSQGNASSTTPGPSDSPSASAVSYKDGSYSASARYYVPPGIESIRVTLTVQNGVVTDSVIQNSQNDPESARFQRDFAVEYKSQVIGKKISSLYLSYIAGASDTTRGFNDAVSQIQRQAKA